MTTRRTFIATAGAAGAAMAMPDLVRAALAPHSFSFAGTDVRVHPVNHASVVLEMPQGVIYVDPVGDAGLYAGLPPADLILVTHEHGDHFNAGTLQAIGAGQVPLIANPAVWSMLPAELTAAGGAIANGEGQDWNGLRIDAIPAYNLTSERQRFHPQGRDNGYVLTTGGARVYVSGDTEDIPEMRALEGIDLAFLCMNLPFTMDVAQAASAVADFAPGVVFPYHYRGRGDGTQDPAAFAALVDGVTEVRLVDWYA